MKNADIHALKTLLREALTPIVAVNDDISEKRILIAEAVSKQEMPAELKTLTRYLPLKFEMTERGAWRAEIRISEKNQQSSPDSKETGTR